MVRDVRSGNVLDTSDMVTGEHQTQRCRFRTTSVWPSHLLTSASVVFPWRNLDAVLLLLLVHDQVHAGAQFLEVGVVGMRRVHSDACVQVDSAASVLGIDGQDGSGDVPLPEGVERVVEERSADSSPPCRRDNAEFIDQCAVRIAGRFRVADAEGDDLPVFDGEEPQRRIEVVFAHQVHATFDVP